MRIQRGLASVLRRAGTFTLRVWATPGPPAAAAVEEVRAWLHSLNVVPDDQDPPGPSWVSEAVPLFDGYLLTIDSGAMRRTALRQIPQRFEAAFEQHGVTDAQLGAAWNPPRWYADFVSRPGPVAQAVLTGRAVPATVQDHPRSVAADPSAAALVAAGITWLGADDPSRPARIAVSGADAHATAAGAQLHRFVLDVVAAGGGCELSVTPEPGGAQSGGVDLGEERLLAVTAAVGASLTIGATVRPGALSVMPPGGDPGLIPVPQDAWVPLVAAARELAVWASTLAAHLSSGYVDFGGKRDEIGWLTGTGDIPWVGEPIHEERIWEAEEWLTRRAHWFQILTPAQRARLPRTITGAHEEPLAGGRVGVVFEPIEEFLPAATTDLPATGRLRALQAADRALGPAFAPNSG